MTNIRSQHRALDDDTVLCTIFETVDDMKTLARSARVCKAFFIPASRILWRYPGTTSRLFRIFSTVELPPPDTVNAKMDVYVRHDA